MIVADPVADDRIVEDLLTARIPVISDRSVEGRSGAHWVDVDVDAAVRETLEQLRSQGARRTALVLPDSTTLFHQGVLAAYRGWCADRGETPRVTLAAEPGNGPVVRAVDAALGGAERPDALFVVAELSPPLVLEAARRGGYEVPRELLVVCVSEDGAAEHTDPPVSTLSLRPGDIARAGMDLLVAALEKGGEEPSGVLVPTRLEVRESSRRRGGGPDGHQAEYTGAPPT